MKTGVTIAKSFRCPVPFHGSLVMKTSPSRIVCSGIAQEMRDRLRHRVDVPGVPVTACASMRPSRVENAGREIARLARRRAESGPQQRLRLLFDDRDQAVPHHLHVDVGDACRMAWLSYHSAFVEHQ